MWQKTRNFTYVIAKLKNSIGGFNDLFPTTKEIMSRKSEKERRWRKYSHGTGYIQRLQKRSKFNAKQKEIREEIEIYEEENIIRIKIKFSEFWGDVLVKLITPW